VAGLPSGDRPGDWTHGAIEGQQEHRTASVSSGPEDELMLIPGEYDLAAEIDPRVYATGRDVRLRTARQREQTAQFRLQTAGARDMVAHARDVAALARDQAADARDCAKAERDGRYERETSARVVAGAEVLIRATDQRRIAAQQRAEAAEDRTLAAQDRHAAARDREHAARDRLDALADREILARRLAIAETDPITGARTRAAGLVDLDGELARCRRTSAPLVVVYVDVVGLDEINDATGHDAGDELLQRVVMLIREHVRSYDLLIRLRHNEFLCVMSGLSVLGARRRFDAIDAALDTIPLARGIRTGFAELMSGESAVELIKRADVDQIASRRGVRHDDRRH
jgi:diguanylate cyclase (GGDEF)-like protein